MAPVELDVFPFRGADAIGQGLLTREQLAGAQWRRLYADVYVHADVPVDHALWCDAAVLMLPPGAAISGWSALSLWCPGWVLPPGRPVEVTAPRGAGVRGRPMLRVRRALLPPGDVERFGDVPLTTPARTSADLAVRGPTVRAVMAADALLTRGLLPAGALASFAQRPGYAAAGRVATLAMAGAESPMESATRVVIVSAGLPCPVPQHAVRDAQGRFVARVDLAYPDRMLAVEYDGVQHSAPVAARDDAVRLRRLAEAGWTVLRFTADDVLRNPERVVVRVARALRAGGGAVTTTLKG